MDAWDDDWAEPRGPSRPGLVVVAVLLLVPFVYVFAGGANAIDALGPGVLAVAAFFVVVALAFVAVRRWLRRRLLEPPPGAGGSFWSDRR